MSTLSYEQTRSIEVVERAMSVLSLLGTLFIIGTFCAFPTFRKPINRLVLFASVGNCLCNVATLISTSGMNYGESSPLCQFQGFFIQMFMPADSLWTFCMALNVYFTFFKNYNVRDLRKLELRYAICCYGIPFIPSMIYLILDVAGHQGIYGRATLWCWVSPVWDWMRIAFFYGPVWIIIFTTTAIYALTGREIFRQRTALRSFRNHNPSVPLPEIGNPFTAPNLAAVTKVTEIQVTTEPMHSASDEQLGKSPSSETGSRSSFSSTRKLSSQQGIAPVQQQNQAPSRFARFEKAVNWPYPGQRQIHDQEPTTKCTTTVTVGSPLPMPETEIRQSDEDNVTFAQDAYSGRQRNAAMSANVAAWGYAKVALLMFLALFVVWVPSTVNRVYSLIRPETPSFPLSITAAAVLPMQGFWNFTVYVATSWPQCKSAWHETASFFTHLAHGRFKRGIKGLAQARKGSWPDVGTPGLASAHARSQIHHQRRDVPSSRRDMRDFEDRRISASPLPKHYDLDMDDIDIDAEHMQIHTHSHKASRSTNADSSLHARVASESEEQLSHPPVRPEARNPSGDSNAPLTNLTTLPPARK